MDTVTSNRENEDILDFIRNQSNIAEASELRRLGYLVDEYGNVTLPVRKSWLDKLRDRLRGEEYGDDGVQDVSRREFLRNSLVLADRLLGPSFPATAAADSGESDNKEVKRVLGKEEIGKIRLHERYIEEGGIETILFAEELCLYDGMPIQDEDIGITPSSNAEFFDRRRHELLGYSEKPPFLVLHTDGGNDTRSTLHSLNHRKIHCQFVVGHINGRPLSIQTVPLRRDRINNTGTVAGGRLNPFEANMQFWGSLNIEIEGVPDEVETTLLGKTVELCIKLMSSYGLKISQVIGHMEVPNNFKPDPGKKILKYIRTKIYIGLLQRGLFHLIDILPGDSTLNELFTIGLNNSGPCEINHKGRAKCWLSTEDDFCDWNVVAKYLSDNHTTLTRLRNTTLNIRQDPIIEIEGEEVSLSELYMGFQSFSEWLMLPGKPLGDAEFREYRPQSTAHFIYRIVNLLLPDNATLIGSKLPISYEAVRNLARLFRHINPYENRGVDTSEAFICIAENIGDLEKSMNIIKREYQDLYKKELA